MRQVDFFKYPEIPYIESCLEILNNPVYVFEKLDGGNCQIRKADERIRVGSRSKFLEGDRINRIWWFRDFIRWASAKEDLQGLDSQFILFGEWLARHNITYDESNADNFYFIDMYDLDENRFLPYDEALGNLDLMGIMLNNLRVLCKGKLTFSQLKFMLNQKSDYRDGTMEGLVVKDYANQRFVKILHPDFSEIAKERNLSNLERYVTERRINKAVLALLEEEEDLTPNNLASKIKIDIQNSHRVLLGERDVLKRVRSIGFRYRAKGR